MKVNIRTSVFETNSSSVHSCNICTEDTYNKFNNGEIWIKQDYYDKEEYLPVDEAIEYNLNVIKMTYDLDDDEFTKFSEVYRDVKNFYEAFNYIGREFDEDEIDLDNYYLDNETYWDYNEYESWYKRFKDSNGISMVAWGYIGYS